MMKRMAIFFSISVTVIFALFLSIYLIIYLLGAPPLMSEENTTFYSSEEEVIGEEHGVESRYYISLDEMSPYIIQSTIAVEDHRFYEHHGFDFKRIIGAIVANIKSLSLKEGASTLTQQYARNLYLTHEKTWLRKLKEAFYTIRLEMFYTKDEILEGYLNTIYFGHGAYGIEAASKFFFQKTADSLSLAEAAMLAGIPKGPTYYSPLNDEERAINRQQSILQLLLKSQQISEEEYTEALNENLIYKNEQKEAKNEIGDYFIDVALSEAAHILKLDKESIVSGGYKIYTTLDLRLQKELETIIAEQMKDSQKVEIGTVTMDPQTGRILTLVGGRSYVQSTFNRAISAKRMPGSTFKPFLYYAALENGYTPNTRLMSKPTSFVLSDGNIYKPSNYNGYYANDAITLAEALALSDNIYAVKTNLFLGPDKLVETARKFGIKEELPAVASLALGTASVTVEEMVRAYATLANGEKELTSYTIEKITDRNGKRIYERTEQQGKNVLDPANAFILTHLLTGMFDEELNSYMSVTGSSIADQLSRPYAGKSGTTTYDSWMIGYSPTLVTGVWTGYDDNRPMQRTSEVALAKNIWAQFMETAHHNQRTEKFIAPRSVVGLEIDPSTGKIATPYCPKSRVMFFKKGTEPTSHCTLHFPGGEKEDKAKEENLEEPKKEKGILRKLFDIFM